MIRSKVNHEYIQKVMRVSTKHLHRDMSTAWIQTQKRIQATRESDIKQQLTEQPNDMVYNLLSDLTTIIQKLNEQRSVSVSK